MGLSAARAMPQHAALHANAQSRRGRADRGDRGPRQSLRALWLSQGDGAAEPGRVQGGQGPGAADLAAGSAESSAKAASAQATVAQPRLVCAVAARAHQSCVEL